VSGQQSENEFSIGGQTARHDRVYSLNGGSNGAVPIIVSSSAETCPSSRLTVDKTWFESVEESGCVDGVCPVPWAVTKSPIAPKGDPVNHPEHYTAGKVEVIEILEQAVQDAPDPISGGLLWQTLKYLLRLWYKGNMLQDAKKARWYLNRLIDRLERDYV
jgi:hypothetical protein